MVGELLVSKFFILNKSFCVLIFRKLKEQANLPDKEVEVEKKIFDEENNLPFKDNSLDLVVSSLK